MIRFAVFFVLVFPFYLSALIVENVEVQGDVRTEESIITNKIEKGKEYSEEELDRIIKELYSVTLFDYISMVYRESDRTLVVTVREHEIISRITFSGNEKIDDEKIKETLNIKKNELLNLKKISANVEKIQNLYREKGYITTFVEYELDRNKEKNEVKVAFIVHEGEKSKIEKVSISGNNFLTDDYIKGRLNTKEAGIFSIFSDDGIDKMKLEEDQARIMYMYNENGFINARVSKPMVSISHDRRLITVNFTVSEGERYKVENRSVSGDKLDDGEYPEYEFRLKKGEWYKHTDLISDINNIKRFYGDEGYPFVTVVPQRDTDDENRMVSVNYNVQKGEKSVIERIEVKGNKRSRDKVIRRELRLYEGELYTFTGEKRSESRLMRTGFFDSAEINIRKGSAPGRVVAQIHVEERRSGTFNIGAGFSTLETFVFNAKVDQRNFLGYGQTISFTGQMSSMRKQLNLSVYEPYFLDYDISLNTGFFFQHYDYDSRYYSYYADYSQYSYGMNITAGIPISDFWRFYLGYRVRKAEYGGATTNQMKYLFRDIFSSAIKTSVSYDTRNDKMFPTRGVYFSFTDELVLKALGSYENILKLSGNFRFYLNPLWKFIFKTNVEFGWNKHLDNESLPFSERYRLGGIYDLRGYPFASIGPAAISVADDGNDPATSQHDYIVGGDKKFVMNAEIELPVLDQGPMKLNLVTFLDAGNSWNTDENYFYLGDKSDNIHDVPMGLFWSAGFGIRWITPMAPFRFEWGFPLTPRPGDPEFVFEFNIANSF
ncbi:MAG: outer membrane protein assembly factor BamA [bacterium]